jgi:hypothetical protein
VQAFEGVVVISIYVNYYVWPRIFLQQEGPLKKYADQNYNAPALPL